MECLQLAETMRQLLIDHAISPLDHIRVPIDPISIDDACSISACENCSSIASANSSNSMEPESSSSCPQRHCQHSLRRNATQCNTDVRKENVVAVYHAAEHAHCLVRGDVHLQHGEQVAELRRPQPLIVPCQQVNAFEAQNKQC